MKQLRNYLNNFPDSLEILKGKHILFDTNVLVNILDDFDTTILEELSNNKCLFTIIHPVFVELLRTNNPSKRTQRQILLSDYNFSTLPMTEECFMYARQIQIKLSESLCFPEPTDLYLAGTLAKYSSNLFLATSNLAHFQSTLFSRECYALLQNTKRSELIHFLKIDKKLIEN